MISASHHCELCQLLFPHIIPGPWVPGLAGMRIRELGGKPVHLLHEGNFSVLLCEPEMISGMDSPLHASAQLLPALVAVLFMDQEDVPP